MGTFSISTIHILLLFLHFMHSINYVHFELAETLIGNLHSGNS